MNNEVSEKTPTRGRGLTGVLVLTLLQALYMVFGFGLTLLLFYLEPPFQLMPFIGYLLLFANSVYSVYAHIGTFKMRRKSAIGLMITLAVFLAVSLYIAVFQKIESDSDKTVEVWAVVFSVVSILGLIIVGKNLKKMK